MATRDELAKELEELKKRLEAEKEQSAQLKDMNDELSAKLAVVEVKPPPSVQDLLSSSSVSSQSAPPSGSTSSVSAPTVELVYMPKDRKGSMFSGHAGTMTFHEWVDDIQGSVTFGRYPPREQAAYLYGHLEGEAQQEIRHCSVEVRRDPTLLLKTLEEAYGHPCSLTQAQKCFFDRKQKDGESLREYSHALLSLAEGVNRCSKQGEVCGEQAVGNQFAENIRDPALRRELKKLLRQDPNMKFLTLRREAILLAEEDAMKGKAAYVSTAGAGVDCANIVSKPDPLLSELRDAMKKQEERMEILTQKLEQLQVQGGRGQRAQVRDRRQEPRYDPAGRPICFRCNKAGNIAHFCDAKASQGSDKVAPGPGGVAFTQELQGNCHPWQ